MPDKAKDWYLAKTQRTLRKAGNSGKKTKE
jgi:hypothetical protein